MQSVLQWISHSIAFSQYLCCGFSDPRSTHVCRISGLDVMMAKFVSSEKYMMKTPLISQGISLCMLQITFLELMNLSLVLVL